jgi:hypothetical protein
MDGEIMSRTGLRDGVSAVDLHIYAAAMTTSDTLKPQLPMESGDPYTRPIHWRRWRKIAVVLLVIAAIAGPLTWWQVAARTNELQPGGLWAPGDNAADLVAGNVEESCYPAVPGSTIVYGFTVRNAGSHSITLTSVDSAFGYMSQTVTVDPSTDLWRGGSGVGPAKSTERLPIAFAPGDVRELYLTMRFPNGPKWSDGQSFTDHVTMHVRTLGISRTEEYPFGLPSSPIFLGLSGPNDQGRTCDFNMPAATD